MSRSQHSRRDFLKKATAAAAAGSAAPYFAWTEKAFANASPNDRPRIGCIGLGDMATNFDAPQHATFGDILAVCDVDARRAAMAKDDGKIGKGKADAYGDYRKILDRHDIDLVGIDTVDHWHVKIAVEALQAGKHVYCEKPLTLTLEENQLIRNACKKYANKVMMVGTQQRGTAELFLRAVNMVQKGLLGKIKKVTVSIGDNPIGGPFPKVAPPK
jgi:predicted dehydrogenase